MANKERRLISDRGPVEKLNRSLKAKMINAFLEDFTHGEVRDWKILDVGCGNGQISEFFSRKNKTSSVDVNDKRNNKNTDYNFHLVTDERLPFGNNQFDLIISHHVIEHVHDQTLHISEMMRTLKAGGLIYLGCPNKDSPFMVGHIGNNRVPNREILINLFNESNLEYHDYYGKLLSRPDDFFCELRVGKYFPLWFIQFFKKWYPSQCFLLTPRSS